MKRLRFIIGLAAASLTTFAAEVRETDTGGITKEKIEVAGVTDRPR